MPAFPRAVVLAVAATVVLAAAPAAPGAVTSGPARPVVLDNGPHALVTVISDTTTRVQRITLAGGGSPPRFADMAQLCGQTYLAAGSDLYGVGSSGRATPVRMPDAVSLSFLTSDGGSVLYGSDGHAVWSVRPGYGAALLHRYTGDETVIAVGWDGTDVLALVTQPSVLGTVHRLDAISPTGRHARGSAISALAPSFELQAQADVTTLADGSFVLGTGERNILVGLPDDGLTYGDARLRSLAARPDGTVFGLGTVDGGGGFVFAFDPDSGRWSDVLYDIDGVRLVDPVAIGPDQPGPVRGGCAITPASLTLPARAPALPLTTRCDVACTVRVSASIKAGARTLRIAPRAFRVPAARTTALRLPVPKATATAVRAALRAGRRVDARVTVRRGAVSTVRTVRLTR